MSNTPNWLDWAIELAAIAQTGLTYTTDEFDRERYTRLQTLAAEIMAAKSGLTLEKVTDLFCAESGYPTPKVDTRTVIFEHQKILLVQETSKLWTLPGGWCDVNQTVKSNVVKETLEETGLRVQPLRILALQDRNLHNTPRYAYNIIKVFVQCEILDGQFQANPETLGYAYFTPEQLPDLATEKTTAAQIQFCCQTAQTSRWEPIFD